MKKNSDNIKDNDTIEAIVGEVLTEQEAEEKKAAIAKRNDRNLIFGSYITKSNDLIQKTKYSLPRNEQKILFMLLSKIDQKRDTDASKYYTITFSEFSKLTGRERDGFQLYKVSAGNCKQSGQQILLGTESKWDGVQPNGVDTTNGWGEHQRQDHKNAVSPQDLERYCTTYQ